MPKATQGRRILTPVTTAPSGDNQTDNLKVSCYTHQGWPHQQLLEAWGAPPGPPAQEESLTLKNKGGRVTLPRVPTRSAVPECGLGQMTSLL